VVAGEVEFEYEASGVGGTASSVADSRGEGTWITQVVSTDKPVRDGDVEELLDSRARFEIMSKEYLGYGSWACGLKSRFTEASKLERV
jgi:hypothetical protein